MPEPSDQSEPKRPCPENELEPRNLEPKEFVEAVTEAKAISDNE